MEFEPDADSPGVERADDSMQGVVSGDGTSVLARWDLDVIAPTEERVGTNDSDGIVLVRARLDNPDPIEQPIRVRNRLDGPVLFPRRQRVPEAGWDREGFLGAVPADGTRALGYACPAAIETPPIELQRAGEPATDADQSVPDTDPDAAPGAVVRRYGDATPPAVVASAHSGPVYGVPDHHEVAAASEQKPELGVTAGESAPSAALPPAVTAWLREVETQLARAEQLEDASVPEATTVLTEAGGLDPAVEDAEALSDTAGALRALAADATALATRAEAVDVPARALRRLA